MAFHQGWNLVASWSVPSAVSQPRSGGSEHFFTYGFNPITQKYVGGDVFADKKAHNELKELSIVLNEIGNKKVADGGASAFVYLNKKQADLASSLELEIPGYFDPSYKWYAEKEQKLFKGWNFLSITPAMAKRRVTDFKGSCVIKKAYGLDYDAQGMNFWNDILDESLNTELIGYGFVIQVENNCSFSFIEDEPIPSIPTLPN